MDDCGPHCEETLREIEAFLDGELDPALRDRVTHHLSDCNPCMQRAEFRKHLKEIVHDKCTEREDPGGALDAHRCGAPLASGRG